MYIHTVDECVKVEKTVEEIVPPAFHAYLDVFRKKLSEQMPTCKSWNHAMDLMPDFVPAKNLKYFHYCWTSMKRCQVL